VCTCLQDREQSLVQRSILDFLLVCLPMHNRQLTKTDMMKVITVSLHLLLKRDMSLNRRIYAWFLGTEQSPAENTNQDQQLNNEIHSSSTSLAITNDPFDSSSYFIQYTRENLIQGLLHALETISSNLLLPTSINGKSKTTTTTTTPDDNNALLTTLADAMPSTWTLTKLIRVLIILGMDDVSEP
jgi:Dopey, N-terminal